MKDKKGINNGKNVLVLLLVSVMGFAMTACGSKPTTNGEAGGTADNNSSNNGNAEVVNTKFTGNVELVKKYDDAISTYVTIEDTNLTDFESTDNEQIFDIETNIVVSTEDTISYLGDDYYLTANDSNRKAKVIKNNQVIFEFDYPTGLGYGIAAYKENILYYVTSINNQKFVVAYNLSTQEELWKAEGEAPFILENNNIVFESYGNSYGIADQNGNIIATADENTKVYPTASNYYFKIINNIVEIYDGTTKISELSLEKKDTVSYTFVSPLSNGMFVLREYDSNTLDDVYKVYDKNLNVITELDDCNDFGGSVLGYSSLITIPSTYNTSTQSIIINAIKDETGIFDVIIYSDGTVEKLKELTTEDGLLDSLSAKTFKSKHYMVGIDNTNGIHGVKLINLDTKKDKVVSDGTWTTSGMAESPNGEYVIINYNTTYRDSKKKIVLDKNLEMLYETDNQLKVVNDKYVVEYSLENKSEIFLVNVFTNEKTKLETVGDYYANNSAGIITCDNGTYNLYSFK